MADEEKSGSDLELLDTDSWAETVARYRSALIKHGIKDTDLINALVIGYQSAFLSAIWSPAPVLLETNPAE